MLLTYIGVRHYYFLVKRANELMVLGMEKTKKYIQHVTKIILNIELDME